jgi:hypothetical protein
MKIKALFLALVIAGATALSYTVHTQDAEQAIEKSKIVRPTRG